MDLNVITAQDVQNAPPAVADAGTPLTADDAFTKLIKLIPPIAVGTFLAVQNVVTEVDSSGTRELLLWLTLGVLLLGSYLYRRRRGIKRASQIAATLIALVIYVFALGGPFAEAISSYKPWWGSIALFLGTFMLVAWNPPPLPADYE